MSRVPSKLRLAFQLTWSLKGRGELFQKERGLPVWDRRQGPDNDLYRRLIDLPSSRRVNGLRCSHGLQWTQMSPLALLWKFPGLVGRGPNQATPVSFPKSLGKSGESVAAMNSSEAVKTGKQTGGEERVRVRGKRVSPTLGREDSHLLKSSRVRQASSRPPEAQPHQSSPRKVI